MPYFILPARDKDDKTADPWRYCFTEYDDPPRYRTDDNDVPMSGPTFDDPATAAAYLRTLPADPRMRVVFIPTSSQYGEWQRREKTRFLTGYYALVPWAEEYFPRHLIPTYHYTHMSLKYPGKVAYTQSIEHGIHDRQTAITPARYLQRFAPEDYAKDAAYVADMVARVAAFFCQDFQIATTARDIVQVYKYGPDSCMHGESAVEVYGDSDLACAYIGDLSAKQVSQRAIIWPERKVYTRVYGTGPLKQLLDAAGYDQQAYAFKGAKVRYLTNDNDTVIMPYVDGQKTVDTCACVGNSRVMTVNGRKWIELGNGGDIDTGRTDGLGEDGPSCDDEDDDSHECGNCDTMIPDGESYCEACYDARFTCGHCRRYRFEHGGFDTYCVRCEQELTRTCEHNRCGETWLEEALDDSIQDERQRLHVAHVCETCATGLQGCASCGELFPVADTLCPHCDTRVHCDYTPNMLEETETETAHV